MAISNNVRKGQAVYSKSVLSIYDVWVLGISNSYIWKCPTSVLLANFDKHITSNHLDLGVGTGYFLDKCRFSSQSPRVVLMDLNQNSLDKTAVRISRYDPEKYNVNLLDKIDLAIEPFDSVSLNYLFHCLPGSLEKKFVVMENVEHLLADNAIIFGATILAKGVERSAAAMKLMSIYNKKGIFSNGEDSLDDLERCLSSRFSEYNIDVHGCVAVFDAKK